MNSQTLNQIDSELKFNQQQAQLKYELVLSRKVAELKQTVKEKDLRIEQLNIAILALVLTFISFIAGFGLYFFIV